MTSASISTLARQCSKLFSRWLNAHPDDPDEVLKVENLLFRFNLWAENNSAYSDGRDSLDWRLRKASVPHSVITDLLGELSAEIISRYRSSPTINVPITTHSEGGLGNFAPRQADTSQHDSADTLLNQLFRFSRAIRRSGTLKRFVRAENHVEYDDNGVNLTSKFREGIMPYLNVTLKSTSQELKNRLLETICMRQKNFSYLRSKKRDMESDAAVAKPSASQTGSRLGSVYSVTGRSTSQGRSQNQTPSQRASQGRRDGVNRARGSPVSATTFNTNRMPPAAEESILDTYGAGFDFSDFPRRPKVSPDPGQRELECPYCFQACSLSEFTDSGWPRHIIQDLMPFICVQEHCHVPNTVYDSIEDWMSHMKTGHARYGWVCMDRSHTSSIPFEDSQEFRYHMRKHEAELTEEELDDIVAESYGTLPPGDIFDGCPFCSDYSDEADDFKLVGHIACHLVFLSQISLSGHDLDVEMDLGSGSDYSTSHSHVVSGAASFPDSRQFLDSPSNLESKVDDELEEGEDDFDDEIPVQRQLSSVGTENWDFMEPRKVPYNPLMDDVIQSFVMKTKESVKAKQTVNPKKRIESGKSIDDFPAGKEPSLYRQLYREAITSSLDGKKFVPLDVVKRVINDRNVASELRLTKGAGKRGTRSKSLAGLAARVTAEAKIVFAILVFMDKVAAINNLLDEERLTDKHLPLSRSQVHDALESCDGTALFPFTGWRNASSDSFVEHTQWLFLAPVLDISGKVIKVHEDCPLPFTSSTVMGGGASGIVHHAEVHPAHQQAFETETVGLQVAIKELYRKSDFAQENDILQKIKHLQHRHIIRHLTSIERGDRGYIIFPWADCGNLHEFWEASKPETTLERALWSMKQMLGLTTALHLLHAYFQCRHGEITPDNILCLTENNQVVLKIADFGVSKVHGTQTMYRKSGTHSVMLTPSYQGPEVEFEDGNEKTSQPRSRRYDIWSLGCVFLEFSIWLLHGPEAIGRFARARGQYGTLSSNSSIPLYEVTDKGTRAVVVHQLVTWTMKCLENDPRCKGETALADLLRLIKNLMLQPEVENRAWAEEIGRQLEKIVNRAERNESYLFHHCDKSRISPLDFETFQPTINP